MNLTEANYLEYTLYLFKEYLISEKNIPNKKLPNYRIVWAKENDLLVGNTLFRDTTSMKLAFRHLDSAYIPDTTYLSVNSVPEDTFPAHPRINWYDKYQSKPNRFTDLEELYKTPDLLLRESIDFVNNLKDKKLPTDPVAMLLDYKNLSTNTELPFILVPRDVELTPVSLIEVSKN